MRRRAALLDELCRNTPRMPWRPAGIEVLMGTPATKLIYAGDPALGDGEVIGVWAKDPDGNDIAIKARYAVVLGTGGFGPESRDGAGAA